MPLSMDVPYIHLDKKAIRPIAITILALVIGTTTLLVIIDRRLVNVVAISKLVVVPHNVRHDEYIWLFMCYSDFPKVL